MGAVSRGSRERETKEERKRRQGRRDTGEPVNRFDSDSDGK